MKLPGDVRDSAAGIDGPQDQSLAPARYAELLRRIEGFEDGTAKARQRMSSPISAPAGVAEDKCPG